MGSLNDLVIDFRSGQPIYLQIVEQIRQKVASGELKPGDQLPTVRQLAAELRVNFNTVARAYRLLDEAGLISTQHGRGTYIWETPSPETLQTIRQQGLESLTRRYLAQAAQLGCTAEEVAKVINPMLERWRESGELPKPEPQEF
ncbi:MAG: GntR family transcriptional regulator [Anaerolineales bacterium]|nr:GntR family transcriptional regulator [Anaerolineales bacterium]MCS7248681.1 GntR family transcriptional regulator [Anaerolineales bacterium]MDW8162494.1 GntR family transcriptional regulator [Anaerolineales bacterium]MDW8447465.1 GntR family transcriptional regulator [Anaerolineales bacterium]